ncbi:Hypothetical predicted protein [Lynx pardinus]|uniref:Uncharacterized protein n=1 Tax=Lynx pardinus TaxID=191816 RepID=A0A485N212_LYNPA|nr:Hypothetical predicted protein [Lynx pardinus]
MSFSPYSAMITVCVCFNSRVQLTVPSFTAWLRSRYSKALFIVLRWPAQEKDKGVCQGCHHVKKWAGRAGPAPPASFSGGFWASWGEAALGVRRSTGSGAQIRGTSVGIPGLLLPKLCVAGDSPSLSGKWEF